MYIHHIHLVCGVDADMDIDLIVNADVYMGVLFITIIDADILHMGLQICVRSLIPRYVYL